MTPSETDRPMSRNQEEQPPKRDKQPLETPGVEASPSGTYPSSQNGQEDANAETRAGAETETFSSEEAISTLKSELENEKNRALRLQAEMINFKNRQEKQRLTWHHMSVKEIVLSFLEPIENLQRALESAAKTDSTSAEEHFKALRDGIKMVQGQLLEALKKHGAEITHPVGEKFDPNSHEAVGHLATNAVPEGYVANVFRTGCKLNDQCIRTAMVQVARKAEG